MARDVSETKEVQTTSEVVFNKRSVSETRLSNGNLVGKISLYSDVHEHQASRNVCVSIEGMTVQEVLTALEIFQGSPPDLNTLTVDDFLHSIVQENADIIEEEE